jgi:hypothetical protein
VVWEVWVTIFHFCSLNRCMPAKHHEYTFPFK